MGYFMDDPNWKHAGVCGIDGFSCHEFGWEVVCLAEALYRSGYTNIKPNNVANRLNSNNGWMLEVSDAGPGVVDVYRLHSLYPQITLGGTQYALVQGTWGVHAATLLRLPDGSYFNPYTGEAGAPARWFPNGRVQTFTVAQAGG